MNIQESCVIVFVADYTRFHRLLCMYRFGEREREIKLIQKGDSVLIVVSTDSSLFRDVSAIRNTAASLPVGVPLLINRSFSEQHLLTVSS